MRLPKTIAEAHEFFKETPYIVKTKNGIEYTNIIFKIESNLYGIYSFEFDKQRTYVGNIAAVSNLELIDWFEETNESITKKCVCDFYSVILTKGCQCGGE